jgi:DNA-binding response OmpR family regulator
MSQTPSEGAPILVADDEPDIRTVVCLRLKRLGHSVMSAENADQAIELARERTPKMCVLDIVMGKTSGLDVVRELRATPETERVPILLLSASVQQADVDLGLKLGADGYLQKPFKTQELLDCVSELLSGAVEAPVKSGSFQ